MPTLVEAALQRHFGFDNFRPCQDAIVSSVIDHKDVMVIMPTGGGKSLCYQLPALILDGVALVISPLIALMKDQVDALQARGIRATLLNSTLTPLQQTECLDGISRGDFKLVYVAPERFRHARFMERLSKAPISFVAVDEAHCVSQWGHDFRPDYLRIGQAMERLGRPPMSAFTATATPEVRSDIIKHLGLRDPQVFVTGFARPNLEFRVAETEKRAMKYARLAELIERYRTGIVYCATRKRVEEVSEHLEEWKVSHIAYHGGLEDEVRKQQQERFIRGEADVAVATNAFGMGIDRSDIRFVVHFETPGSVEAYYQEAGRAGRDGLPALCELFFNFADRRTQDFFIDGNNPSAEVIRDVYRFLLENADANHEVHMSLRELAERLGCKNGMMVSSSVNILSRFGIVDRFDVPGKRIRGTRIVNPALAPSKLPLDASALSEKERRDRAKLEAIIRYGYSRGCRQEWILSYFGEHDAGSCGRCDTCQEDATNTVREPNAEEWTIIRKALSGVARMSHRTGPSQWEPRFGRGRIVLMLLGSQSEQIVTSGLNRLSTYGVLRSESGRYVNDLFDELLRSGLLRTTGGDRPLITLTELGDAVMKGHIVHKLRLPTRASTSQPRPTKTARSKGYTSDDVDDKLLDILKKKRAQIARIQGNIAPFKIFSNAVLESLARVQPRTVDEAMEISGIGPVKARKTLPPFLEIIEEYRYSRFES